MKKVVISGIAMLLLATNGKSNAPVDKKLFKDNEVKWSSYGIPILIENSAYRIPNTKKTGFTMNTINNINELYDSLKQNFKKSYVSGCLDTAHLFAAGVPPNEWNKIKLNNIYFYMFYLIKKPRPISNGG